MHLSGYSNITTEVLCIANKSTITVRHKVIDRGSTIADMSTISTKLSFVASIFVAGAVNLFSTEVLSIASIVNYFDQGFICC
jgi:hypothetical protein